MHLEGISEIEIADGMSKQLHPGDILVAQDSTGREHITWRIGDGLRISINAPLEDGPWLPNP